MSSNAVRDLRYKVYAGAWGRGDVPGSLQDKYAAAAGIGVYQQAVGMPIMLPDEFHRLHELLDTTHVIAPEQDDECDVGPSARDERIMAEAHARLSKLILAGGHVETGGRSLYESAADEIVRLRAELSGAQHAAKYPAHDETRRVLGAGREEATSDAAQRVVAELQQAKEALGQARAKVDDLRREVEVDDRLLEHRTQLLEALPCPLHGPCVPHTLQEIARLQGAEKAAREQGAAEMRERAAGWCERLATLEKYGISRRALEMAAGSIRALPLSGAPAPHVDIDAAERRRSETFRALDGAGAPFGEAMAGASDAARSKPAPARGTPGKATGAEATEAGKDSVAEDRGEAQGGDGETPLARAAALLRRAEWRNNARLLESGKLTPRRALVKMRSAIGDGDPSADEAAAMAALEALITEPAAPPAQAPAALPKPKRADVGQRWKHTNDPNVWTVSEIDRHNDDMLVTLRTDSGRVVRVCESWLIGAPFWTFLGPAPADPPRRDDEPVLVPGVSDSCVDPTSRSAYAGRPVARGAPAEASEPTARDAVAGMLLRAGRGGLADDLARGDKTPAQALATLRMLGDGSDAIDRACIAALEALARGDLRGARDHQDLLAAIERLTRERDSSRSEAASLREELERIQREWEEQGARLHEIEATCDRAWDALGTIRTGEDLAEAVTRCLEEARDGEVMTSADGRVTLIVRDKADARDVAAACVELLGLSSDEVHGGNVVEAFEAGVAEGERRGKAKAEEVATAWIGDASELDGAAEDERAKLKAGKPSRYMLGFMSGGGNARRQCAQDIRAAFCIEPADSKPPTGEPAPEASDVVAPPVPADLVARGFDDPRETLDWTIDTNGRVSGVFMRLVLAVARLIVCAEADRVTPAKMADQIMRHLAHVHGLAPRAAAPEADTVSRSSGGVTITALDGMTLGEVWSAIKARPEMKVCLDAELRQARESARGTTPAELETARRDIRAAVLDDAFRAGVESAHVDRAALLDLATGWEAKSTEHHARARAAAYDTTWRSNEASADALDMCAADLRRLLDAPRDPALAPEQAHTSPPGAPDRDALGRAGHEVREAYVREFYGAAAKPTAWDEAHRAERETLCRIGERLFNMGVQWAQQNAAAPAAEPEAQDERWQPGAVWEWARIEATTRHALLHTYGGGGTNARLAGLGLVRIATMTEANGWRYVGPAKAG